MIPIIFSLQTNAESDCELDVTSHGGIVVKVKVAEDCVTILCSQVNARNIESALALCHETEKDHKFCGWHTKRSVKEANIQQVSNSQFPVSIKKCNT